MYFEVYVTISVDLDGCVFACVSVSRCVYFQVCVFAGVCISRCVYFQVCVFAGVCSKCGHGCLGLCAHIGVAVTAETQ